MGHFNFGTPQQDSPPLIKVHASHNFLFVFVKKNFQRGLKIALFNFGNPEWYYYYWTSLIFVQFCSVQILGIKVRYNDIIILFLFSYWGVEHAASSEALFRGCWHFVGERLWGAIIYLKYNKQILWGQLWTQNAHLRSQQQNTNNI